MLTMESRVELKTGTGTANLRLTPSMHTLEVKKNYGNHAKCSNFYDINN